MKTTSIVQEAKHFKKGLWLLEDDSDTPFGSARSMMNVIITDRGGIAPRPGTALLGTYNPTIKPIRGLFNFTKSLGSAEILLKSYDTKLEYYHNTFGEDWNLLKGGFTTDQEFGFTTSLVNTENEDFVYFCNRFESYQRWLGAVTQLNGALVGGETSIIVDSTIKTQILEAKTATANSTTTIDVSGTPWTASMWVNFYVYITSGGQTGKVRKITANTSSQITFDALGSAPGNCTFEIRQLAFPASGSLIYGGTVIAYTGIDTATSFTVASAHAAADNTVVTVVPEEFVGAPRGNRLENLLGRVYVGNVRSALSRDSGGSLQGSAQAGSVFVSKIRDPKDFGFAATRVAGEGDIIAIPYGGGPITSIVGQEDVVYVYKETYIEAMKYTNDTSDVVLRDPLKTGIGSVGKVIRGQDDHYFMNSEKEFTSLGRVKLKDLKPQTENMAHNVKRLLDGMVHTDFDGVEFSDRIISCHKSSESVEHNDVMLVYNKSTKSYEGVWLLPANAFTVFEKECYYGSSVDANVWQLFKNRKVDIRDENTEFGYSALWQSNFFSVVPIKGNFQSINSVYLEGRIKSNSSFTFKLLKDFQTDAFLSFDFRGTETDLLTGSVDGAFLGGEPISLSPLGTISGTESDGFRRFAFTVYFPWQYAQYISTSIQSTGKDQDWELNKCGLGIKESVSTKVDNIKSI